MAACCKEIVGARPKVACNRVLLMVRRRRTVFELRPELGHTEICTSVCNRANLFLGGFQMLHALGSVSFEQPSASKVHCFEISLHLCKPWDFCGIGGQGNLVRKFPAHITRGLGIPNIQTRATKDALGRWGDRKLFTPTTTKTSFPSSSPDFLCDTWGGGEK